MGTDPRRSIVDRGLVHHQVRNLLVLGGGAFPTSSPVNPTLTLSALSLVAGPPPAGIETMAIWNKRRAFLGAIAALSLGVGIGRWFIARAGPTTLGLSKPRRPCAASCPICG